MRSSDKAYDTLRAILPNMSYGDPITPRRLSLIAGTGQGAATDALRRAAAEGILDPGEDDENGDVFYRVPEDMQSRRDAAERQRARIVSRLHELGIPVGPYDDQADVYTTTNGHGQVLLTFTHFERLLGQEVTP